MSLLIPSFSKFSNAFIRPWIDLVHAVLNDIVLLIDDVLLVEDPVELGERRRVAVPESRDSLRERYVCLCP